MLFKATPRIFCGILAGILLTAAGTTVHSEVTKQKRASEMRTPIISQAPRIATDTPLHVECWQEGRKIIDEEALYGFSVSSLLDRGSVSFRRAAQGDPTVFIVSLKHSTCLIRGASSGNKG